MLQRLDQVLTQFIKYLERLPIGLSRISDYVLAFITRASETLVRVLRRAISIIFRFLRELTTNLVKIAWHLLQLALVPFLFTLVLCFGLELRNVGYWKTGLGMMLVAGAGLVVFVVAFLASFAKSNTEEQKEPITSNTQELGEIVSDSIAEEQKEPITSNTQELGEIVSDSIAEEQYDYVPDSDRTKVKGKTLQAGVLVMDLVALGLVLYLTFAWAHWFSNPILRTVQVVECRALLTVLSVSNRSLEGPFARAMREAIGPPPLRAGIDTQMPTRLKTVPPKFSQEARRPEAFGTVSLDLLVSTDGKVRSIKITESLPMLDNEIKAAVSQWEYKPTIVAGQPVPVVVPIEYIWAGDPLPPEALAGITGTGRFENESLLTGTLKNNGKWTLGWVTNVFKGPKDETLPVKWERRCEISEVIPPGQERKLRCEMEKVDLSANWRWHITAAWGLPSN
jgi:TonB family protein